MDQVTFNIYLGKSWKRYREYLHQTADCVISAFGDTDLGEKVRQYYQSSLPGNHENLLHFLKRNHFQSYRPTSERTEFEEKVDWGIKCVLFGLSRFPVLNRKLSVQACSAELYIGQDQQTTSAGHRYT